MAKTAKKSKNNSKKTADLHTIIDIIVNSNRAIDANFEIVNVKLNKLDLKVDKLGKSSNTEFGKVGKQLKEIKTEVHKIQRVSGYSDMFENLKVVS